MNLKSSSYDASSSSFLKTLSPKDPMPINTMQSIPKPINKSSLSLGIWSPFRIIAIMLLLFAFMFFIFDSMTDQISFKIVKRFMLSLILFDLFRMSIIFLFCTCASLIFVFPTTIIGLSGGYLYGVKLGFVVGFLVSTIVTQIGLILGCFFTFQISRYLYSSNAGEYKKEDYHPVVWGIRKALEKKGLQINILLRLTFLPAQILNYTLPPLGTKLSDFLLGAFIGSIPYSVFISLLGSMLTDVTEIELFLYHQSPTVSILLCLLGIFCVVLVIYLIYKYAKEALNEVMEEESKEMRDTAIFISPSRLIEDSEENLKL